VGRILAETRGGQEVNFTVDELKLIKSALECDTQGTWGDLRQEKIDQLLKKIKEAGR
jgi:hypothetical protein